MISMGYDPGLAKGGVAVVERVGTTLKLLHVETITTLAEWTDEQREAFIFAALSQPLREFHPVILGIENQRGVATAARMHAKRVIAAVQRGGKAPAAVGFNANSDGVVEVVGLAKGCARAYGVRCAMVEPRSVKVGLLGIGGGEGDKAQIKRAVQLLFPEAKRMSSHGADATAIAIVAGRIALLGVAA